MSIRTNGIHFFFSPSSFAGGDFYIMGSFSNTSVIDTEEGLVIFDISVRQSGPWIFRKIREISDKPIKFIIYSHGHFDHCFGYFPFINEIKEKNWIMPEIIAHENCTKRFEKYKILEKYHVWLNSQQFASLYRNRLDMVSAQETLDPTIKIRDYENYKFKLGQYSFEVYPEWGETDDAVWMYVPEREVIFTGDLFIWGYPNIGNPYKVQRYPKHWAEALKRMAKKNANYLVPGHGPLIKGQENVREALLITAEAMDFVHDEVVKRMNQGKWFEEIYHEMLEIYPDKFKNSQYLRPIYGCYRFGIHATYRLYHGWYNTGNPTDLFPAKSADIAKELLSVAGPRSEDRYLTHALRLFEEGQSQLALHMLDVIINGMNQENDESLLKACELKFKILKEKARAETSFITANIINNGALELKNRIKIMKKNSE